jgi:hypothetical protein
MHRVYYHFRFRPCWFNFRFIVLASRGTVVPDSRVSFNGFVAGGMRPSGFQSLFRKQRLDEGSDTPMRADGTVLMRAPFDIDIIGQGLRKSAVFDAFLPRPAFPTKLFPSSTGSSGFCLAAGRSPSSADRQ